MDYVRPHLAVPHRGDGRAPVVPGLALPDVERRHFMQRDNPGHRDTMPIKAMLSSLHPDCMLLRSNREILELKNYILHRITYVARCLNHRGPVRVSGIMANRV